MTDDQVADERRGWRPGSGSTKRTWWAIGVGTAIQIVSFGALLFGAIASINDDSVAGGPAFALGFILAPAVFASVAFISANERAPSATLKAMGLWLLVSLTLGVFNPVGGLCLGFGFAGAITLRKEEATTSKHRYIAVLLNGAYVILLVVVIPDAGVFAGAVTPLLAVRSADIYSQRAQEKDSK